MKIVIMGYGFVGRSVHNSLVDAEVGVYDPEKGWDVIAQCDAVFICVPTPTQKGKHNYGIVEKCIEYAKNNFSPNVIIIKSTILPEVAGRLCRDGVIYCPEFLDQANPYHQTKRHIVGTDNIFLFEHYKSLFPSDHEYLLTDPRTASMVKYVHNTHGALKVAFFNEVFDACQKDGIDYREMLRILLATNDNVGGKYTQISADGLRGFGGTCFPKDTSAFYGSYKMETLGAALKANKRYGRKEQI